MKPNPSNIRNDMLSWYDTHARTLPWRSKPFERPDPYHVWMSEVMLQQTTVGAVIKYFEKFIEIWPTVQELANAPQDDVMREWAGLGYYSRARNLHKCAIEIIEKYNSKFPKNIKTLKSLPGIGDYTSAAIASIAFDIPATVIDGNVERVISRLYRIETPLPDSKPIIREYANDLFIKDNQDRPSCFAQSLMDLGATICTPKSPKCMLCPISEYCTAYAQGDAANFPFKRKKVKIPEKHALAYIYIHDNEIGIEKRPDKGMLGGMVGFPTSDWVDVKEALPDHDNKIFIRHVFTHFALTLYPVVIHEKTDRMIDKAQVDNIGLPTLFQKLWNMIKSSL
jgi:A/G-specific adenine glycosylase